MGVSLFSPVTNNRTRGNSHHLHNGSFRLDIRKNLLTEYVVKLWHRLLREVVEPLPLVFKSCVDAALSDMAQWWTWRCRTNSDKVHSFL